MRRRRYNRTAPMGAALGLLALACAERGFVVDPTGAPEEPTASAEAGPIAFAVTCEATPATGSLACARPPVEARSGGPSFLIVGGQGTFVQLTSSNVSYDGSAVFQADVTVQNLIGQPLGTDDGTTETGVRVFFHSGPAVTSGSGVVTVRNPDGTSTFTGSDQPYFEYVQSLSTNEVSVSKRWEWDVPTTATTFAFQVLVEGDVEHVDGWVEVSPPAANVAIGADQLFTAVVRDVVGRVVPAGVTWASSAPGIATVSAGGLATGVSQGVAAIVATSTASPADGSATLGVKSGDAVLQLVASGFDVPLYATAPPGDAGRLFVVERGGKVKIVSGGNVLATPFLDITSKVSTSGEGGLLSLAFHPDYATNGHFYVYYRENQTLGTQVERYTVSSGDPDVADAGSGLVIIHQPQPTGGHMGGQVAFGPDGFLYLGLGDGGHPVADSAQDTTNMLGSMLRLDVDVPDPGLEYGLPDDNPFVLSNDTANGARGEIFIWGVRNPWRFSFDRTTGHLYTADVGNTLLEEVDVHLAGAPGANYGWPIQEGTSCNDPPSNCNPGNVLGLVDPVFEYDHTEGCSITGGYVYRGSAVPALAGAYLYGDWCAGWIRSFEYDGATVSNHLDWSPDLGTQPAQNLVSFGEDGVGELYVVQMVTGEVYRIEAN